MRVAVFASFYNDGHFVFKKVMFVFFFLSVLGICPQTSFGDVSTKENVVSLTSKKYVTLDDIKKDAVAGVDVEQYELGYRYLTGEGVQQNSELAIEWLRKAADQKNAKAQLVMELAIYDGKDVQVSHEKVLPWYNKNAQNSAARVQFMRGFQYLYGEGVKKDTKEALKYLTQSAESGYVYAQYLLGRMYARGDGVKKDSEKAVKWLKKPAEYQLGYAFRMFLYAYIETKQCNKAPDSLEKCLLEMAKDSDALQYQVGFLYSSELEIIGGKPDYAKAYNWMIKPADKGYLPAQFAIATYYSLGKFGSENRCKSIEWYWKAAVGGYAQSQKLLAYEYILGRCVDRNYFHAYKWLIVAALNGDKDAVTGLKQQFGSIFKLFFQ